MGVRGMGLDIGLVIVNALRVIIGATERAALKAKVRILKGPFVVALVAFLSACGSSDGDDRPACDGPLSSGIHQCGLISGAHNRYYQMRVPRSYNGEPMPLILDLHGYGSPVVLGLSGERLVSGMDRVAQENGVVVAWPQGIKNGWNSAPSNVLEVGDVNDVEFLLALVEEIKSIVNVDSSRVYIMGISNGGAMAQVVACEASATFAAVSTVAFQIPMEPVDCNVDVPIPMISFHAPTDILVPFNGSHQGLPNAGLSAPESYDAWSDLNGCVDESETYFSKGNSSCEMRSSCAGGVSVAFCSIDGEGQLLGGHLTYINNDNVRLSEHIWALFSQYQR